MKRLFVKIMMIGIALALVLMLDVSAAPVSASSAAWGIQEITFTTGSTYAKSALSGDGARIAFQFDRDLTGGNPDYNDEIFLYDASIGSFTQITDTNITDSGHHNEQPSISEDGSRVVFASDHDPAGGNADGNEEIFLYDTSANSLTQITDTPGLVNDTTNKQPAISGDGTRIAFVSRSDLTGGNAGHSDQIFLYDTLAGSFTQITNAAGGTTFEPSISDDGTRIAFSSNRDLVAGGNADGNFELFLYDTAAASLRQVTDSVGGHNVQPSISGDGSRVAFASTVFSSGGNADGNYEIFLYDTATGGISQVTFTTEGPNYESNSQPSISDDGTRVAFRSNRDLTGGNADGNYEIFFYDTATNSFTQVMDTTGGFSGQPSISADGTRIAFDSNRFFSLGNADGSREIFLASSLSPQPADLLISQSADKTGVKQGNTLTYTITVSNFGPGAADGVVVNDILPSGATFVGAQANKGSFTAPPVNQTGTVTWDLGDLVNGGQESAQIQVTVMIRGKSTITNTATVSSSTADPNLGNNSTSLTTTVLAGSSGKKK